MISQLGLDRQSVLDAVAKDPLLSTSTNEQIKNNNNNLTRNLDDILKVTNDILTLDNDLSVQLEDLHKLKTFRDLIMEFNANLELFEFENCYYSLKTLRNKIKDYNMILLGQPFHFQRSLMKYIDSMHLKLIDNIYYLLFHNFWTIQDNQSISFHSNISIGEGDQLEYKPFITIINELFFTDSIDHDWFLNDMGICPEAEELRKKLFEIDSNFIKYDVLINIIKQNMFDSKISFQYDHSQGKLVFVKLGQDVGTSQVKIDCIIESFKSVTKFLHEVKLRTDSNNLLVCSLGPIISNELIKFVRSNATTVLYTTTSDKSYLDDLKAINEGVIKLAKGCDKWYFNGSDLLTLINDKTLYYNILTDQNFNDTINEFKMLLANNKDILTSKETVSFESSQEFDISKVGVEYTTDKNTLSQSKGRLPKKEETQHTNDEQHDEEDDVDAWDEEIDFGIDDEHEEDQLPEDDTNIGTREEEDHDAWDDEWDIGNEVGEDEEEKVKGPLKESSLQITKIPHIISNCINLFETKCKQLNGLNEDYYNQKLASLQTVIFVMIQTKYPEDQWWQLYADCKYFTANLKNSITFTSLLNQWLNNIMIRHKVIVKQAASSQLKELQKNEANPSWSPILDKLLPHVSNNLLGPLSQLQNFPLEYQAAVLDIIDFIYNKCIVDVILKWDIISEKNSENLGELISLISDNICVDKFDRELRTISSRHHNPPSYLIQYRQLREKFQLIGKFLPLHLKDIMEMFYNGDFYLFSTQEIIQWITLLFADTPLRQDAITDIYEIRAAAAED